MRVRVVHVADFNVSTSSSGEMLIGRCGHKGCYIEGKQLKFELKQRVRHVASGLTYFVAGLTIDGQALIDYHGEGISRAVAVQRN